jgi:16S rRNA processing protein RimM
MADRLILLGQIGRPHGVRGLVHVASHTAEPADLASYGALVDDHGRRWRLRWRGEGIAELTDDATGEKLADRNAAEKLVNTRLHIERDRLPAPDEDEFYLADLIGLAASDASGQALGRVAAVHDYGAGASLEIVREGGSPLIVPFTRAVVPEIDVAGGRLTVVPPDEISVAPDAAGEAA